jgi:uncharacterized protein YllA (UPF0747 family)
MNKKSPVFCYLEQEQKAFLQEQIDSNLSNAIREVIDFSRDVYSMKNTIEALANSIGLKVESKDIVRETVLFLVRREVPRVRGR